MRLRSLLPALGLALGLGALVVAPAPAAEPADARKVDKLIEDLGSSDFEVREKATRRLEEVGEPALPALRKAAAGKDVEVRKRAGSLVSKLEKKVEAEKILKPTMLRLKFKDSPLKEALEEFRKKSGYNLVLLDPEDKLKDRKVTLDTGKVTFWDALDQFCKKAGVVEYDPSTAVMAPPRGVPAPGGPAGPPAGAVPGKPGVAPPAKPPAKEVPARPAKDVAAAAKRVGALTAEDPPDKPVKDKPAEKPAGGGGAKAGAGGARPGVVVARPVPLPVPPGGGPGGMPMMPMPGGVPTAPGQITLVDGKYKERPADTRTSVRVRAASDSKVYGTAPEGTILLPLQVSPEPKLQWQRLVSVRVDKAVDDRGQKLTQTTPGAGGFGGGSGPAGGGVAVPGGGGGIAIGRPMGMPYNPMVHTTPLYLKKGEKVSKKLKVLEGVISAEVLAPAEQLIVADNVLKAEDKTFKGKDGGRFKVLKVEKGDAGQLTITFEMEQPAGAIPDNTGATMMPPGGMPPGVGGPPIKAPPPLPPVKKGGAGGGAPPPAAKPAVPPPGGAGGGVAVKGGVAIAVPAGGGGGGAMMMRPRGWNFGVTLRDDKGTILPAFVGMNFKPGVGIPREYVLRYTPEKGHGKPAQLVFSGRRSVPVNIPFILKEVTLP